MTFGSGGNINILVRAPNWLGDIMLCTPALSLLRKIHPDALISVLVKDELKEGLSGNPSISKLLTFPSGEPLLSRLKLYCSLREKKFDLAILFTNSFESALCSFIASAERRVGYNRDFRRALLTHPVPTPDRLPPRLHQSEYYTNLVKQPAVLDLAGKVSELNLPLTGAEQPMPFFHIPDSAREEASEVWKGEGLDLVPVVIGFGPGAAFGTAKRWPPERYAELGDRVTQELGGRVVIFGSGADRGVADEILAAMSESGVSLAGKTSIKGLGALLDRCDAYVTNDSGPMHMAAALNTPVIAIFGPTDPSETAPLSKLGETVIEQVNCSPCWKRECPTDHRCMESISPNDVMKALRRALNSKN